MKRRAKSEYSTITRSTSTALPANRAAAGTPMVYMLIVNAQMTSAPMALATRENRPPLINVPPSTTAKIASNS